ncbi:ATP-binding protein [Roseomonas elaeocarpi]|uniref:histidine kinase n=1 Tax=Roseomonas elaeocarpi TaxID=907779 RepID=A0ABV6JP39_9PROT
MRTQFALAGVIAAAPALCLLLMGLGGAAGWFAVGWSLAVTLAASVALAGAAMWVLERLAEALRGAAVGEVLTLPRMQPLRDVADALRRLTDDLRESGALVGRLRAADVAILEALPDPLMVLGADRAPLRANAAARTLFGASGPAPLSGDIGALLRHPALAGAVDRAMEEGDLQVADLALPVPVPRELSAQAIPLDPPLSDGGRLLVVLSDRTRDRAVERMRADFVANASHELRTPLASLIGFIDTLQGPARDDPTAQERFLAIMGEQAERMRRLIDDLLDLSRIEVSEHLPPQGAVDLVALCQAEAEALAPILVNRQVRLEMRLDPAVARPADSGQLAQVLRNLVENAVRHGREGGTAQLSTGTRDGGVTITVQDDGPGIPKQHIPRLTERFYRVDKGRSRSAGGTGLGLAIVKHIVNRHRGRLIIESPEGQGARFQVWLPGEAGARAPGKEPAIPHPESHES